MRKDSKLEDYLDRVEKFAVYVDRKERIIEINSRREDLLTANKSYALKKLKNLYKYKIKMVIK